MGKLYSFGDSDKFAVRFEFNADPDAGSFATPKDAASWGSLQIWANGENLTRHVDRERGEHDGLTWYLRPALSWLTALPERVLRDIEAPIAKEVERATEFLAPKFIQEGMTPLILAEEERLDFWRRRHALTSSRRGGIFPEIVFRRVDDDVEISWSNRFAPSLSGARFRGGEGTASVPIVDFLSAVSELRTACAVLGIESQSDGIEGSTLLDRISALTGATDSDLVVDDQYRLGPLGLLSQTLDPTTSDADLSTIIGQVVDSAAGSPLIDLADEAVGASPFDQGFSVALALRSKLGLGDAPLPELPSLFSTLGIKLLEQELATKAVRATATYSSRLSLSPVVSINTTSPFAHRTGSRRASALHALGHLLLSQSTSGSVGIAQGTKRTRTPIARRAGSFAAMMLATRSMLQSMEPTASSVSQFANFLGATPSLLVSHATNLDIFSPAQRDELELEMNLMIG